MSYELRAAVRAMLLPIVSSREDGFLAEVESRLNGMGVVDDQANWIRLQLRRWKHSKTPTPLFKKLVRELLFLTDRDPNTFMFDSVEGRNGDTYRDCALSASTKFFEIHKTLVDQHLLSHDAARQILSHAGMIARLAIEERMTASEISRLITVRDNRFSLNWRVVKAILGKLGCAPKLSVEDFERVFHDDRQVEPDLFGDLDLPGCIERIGEIADTLGCTGEFAGWLADMFITQMHAPYLPLLHFQLTIQAEYDHAVTYAYEFNPRGSKGEWMTDRYIQAWIPVGKSAVLNNSKATLRFDKVWVAGRDDNLLPATALASILEAIENLGVLAKDELAAQIRGLLHRYIRVKTEEHGGVVPHLVNSLSEQQAARLVRAIGVGNSGTTGILEQRLVDALGMKRHEGWSARGLRDSVFAASTFRKKFGDVEFENPVRPTPHIVAYESHGGRLSAPYVVDHLDTFSVVLAQRQEELEAIAPLPSWNLEVVFVAHDFEIGLPNSGNALGCKVELRYLTFADAAEELCNAESVALVNEHLVEPLNSGYVHPQVREIVHGFL